MGDPSAAADAGDIVAQLKSFIIERSLPLWSGEGWDAGSGGFVDRLDVAPDGRMRVVDYKSGAAPGEGWEAKALFQMKFYALVLWRTRGVVPAMLQLVYLGSGELIRYVPDEQDLRATERKVEAIWRAIAKATESGDWRPNRSKLCEWCSFQSLCPEFGGTPPPLPIFQIPPPAADPAGDVDTDEGVAGQP